MDDFWNEVVNKTQVKELMKKSQEFKISIDNDVTNNYMLVEDNNDNIKQSVTLSSTNRTISDQRLLNNGNNRLWFLGTGSAIPSKYRYLFVYLLFLFNISM